MKCECRKPVASANSLTGRSSGHQHLPWLRHCHGQCWSPSVAALLPAPLTLGVRPSMKQAARFAFATISMLCLAQAKASSASFDETFSMPIGIQYVVHLKQATPARLSNKNFQSFGHWGAEGARQSFCVSSLQVIRRKVAIRVPGKSYADLCNVSSLELSERKGLFVVALRGGDAGDSFTAEFVFRGVYLIERMVRHGEFPEAYERTQYRYNTSEN